jgi:hypothetical protein
MNLILVNNSEKLTDGMHLCGNMDKTRRLPDVSELHACP